MTEKEDFSWYGFKGHFSPGLGLNPCPGKTLLYVFTWVYFIIKDISYWKFWTFLFIFIFVTSTIKQQQLVSGPEFQKLSYSLLSPCRHSYCKSRRNHIIIILNIKLGWVWDSLCLNLAMLCCAQGWFYAGLKSLSPKSFLH